MRIILASTSAGRKELLDKTGIKYEIIAPTCEEIPDPKKEIRENIQNFANEKAKSVFEKVKHEEDIIVIGCDSVADFENQMIGKPKTRDEAKAIIKKLRGNQHLFVTAITIMGNLKGKYFEKTEREETVVGFRSNIPDEDIEKYLDFNDWKGKAGGYTIMGAAIFLIDWLEGDFHNIIGIPLRRLGDMIRTTTGKSIFSVLEKR